MKSQIEFGGETMRREIRVRAMRCFATTLLTAFAIGLFASAGWAEEDMRYHDLTTYDDLRRRSAFDAERAYYYRVRGLNLGLDSRFIDAEYQRPGLFGISLFYDEMPKYQTDTATTFMRNAGDGFLTLPSDWVGNGPALPSDSINDIDSFLRSCPTTSTSTRAISTKERKATSSRRHLLANPGPERVRRSYPSR